MDVAIRGHAEANEAVTNSHECDVAERFLDQADEDSFNDLFQVYSPQLVPSFAAAATTPLLPRT